jgi:hypothetical protein
MAQEIYHRSEWGNPSEQWGNVYLNADLTNELYKRASEYENSWVTDQLLNGVGIKPSIILTPTAYEDGKLNSVKPKGGENLLPYSEDFTQNPANGTKEFTTEVGNPSNASGKSCKITATSVNGQTRLDYGISVPSVSTKYAFSCFIKKGNTDYAGIGHFDAAATVIFEFSTETITLDQTGTAGFEKYNNGWYRLFYNVTVNPTNNYNIFKLHVTNSATSFVNAQIGDFSYFWGAQLEKENTSGYNGEYATSYIPTYGSTATRLGETANNAGDVNVFNSEEGVLYFEAKTDNTDAGSISINNGTLSVRITARVRPDISKIQMAISGSTDDFNYNSETITLSEYNKIAIVYNNGQYYFFINGVKSTIQNKGTFNANSFTQFDFNRGGGGEIFYGKVKNVKVFNKALTDRELEILTIQ